MIKYQQAYFKGDEIIVDNSPVDFPFLHCTAIVLDCYRNKENRWIYQVQSKDWKNFEIQENWATLSYRKKIHKYTLKEKLGTKWYIFKLRVKDLIKKILGSQKKTLHVEDMVTIRTWDDMISEFGFDEHGSIKTRWPYAKGMKSLCGNTYEIYRIDVENNKYGLTAGGSNVFIRNFSKDMFEECKHTTLFNKILKKFQNLKRK